MVHDPLPEDWREQLDRAYEVFSVDEFGFRSSVGNLLRGSRRYWTPERLRAKEEKQLEDPKTHRWVKRRGGLPGREARASIDVDDDEEVDELPAATRRGFRLPEISPGVSPGAKNIPVGDTGAKVQQVYPVPAPAAITSKALLDQVNAIRAEQGLEPLMGHDGTWANNGADLRTLNEAAQLEMMDRLRAQQDYDPRAAGSIEEMTANIIDAFKAASPVEREYGEKWYEVVARQTLDLAEEFGVDPHLVAALIASTSPRTEWSSNLAATRLTLMSLLPEYSPQVNKAFLNTRMTHGVDLDGKPLELDEDGNFKVPPPTGLQYILSDDAVRASFVRKNPRLDGETDDAYEQRISDTIEAALNQRDEDGMPLQIYQFRDQKLRAALIDVNNRALAAEQILPEGVQRRPGMGLQVPTYTSDGYLQNNAMESFRGILEGNVAVIDRLFGYSDLDQTLEHLPRGWSGLPDDEVELYHRIDETLGGHKTRSFYNNIITAGLSDFATIDVHALRAALLGKAATRSGAAVPGAEDLLVNPVYKKLPKLPKDATPEQKAERAEILAARTADYQRWRDEKRVGVYATVNEAFRLATEQVNAERAEQGLEPLSVAQVQAVAWIAARPNSIAADFSNMAMQERDPARVAARVLPGVPVADRERALELVGASGSLASARRNLGIAGIDASDLTDDAAFRRAKAATKPVIAEFNTLRQPGTMKLTKDRLATAAWLVSQYASDAKVAQKIRETFADKNRVQPPFTEADAALVRQILSDRYTKADLLNYAAKGNLQARLTAYNEQRRRNGVVDEKGRPVEPFTYTQFLEFIRTGDYV